MKEINEIKSIEIELCPNGKSYKVCFNGERAEKYELKTTEGNALHAARALTRAAMNFWDIFDAKANAEEEE